MDPQYEFVSNRFGMLTPYRSEMSGRCCEDVDSSGTPLCCYTVADGTSRMEFTEKEIRMLGGDFSSTGMFVGPDMIGVVTDPVMVLESLRDGLLAKTHESMAHPTRPIVKKSVSGWRVVGIASVRDCEWRHHETHLRSSADAFIDLWQISVNMIGVKAHYPTPDSAWPGIEYVL